MKFEKGQSVYFIYRAKKRKKNSHTWKVKQGIVFSDDNGVMPKVEIKSEMDMPKQIKRRCVFADLESAKSKCEHWNNWSKYHKNTSFRGKRHK